MNFDAVDMAKYLNYGLNYKNTFRLKVCSFSSCQFLGSGKSLITSLSLTVLILTAEDVQAKETKGKKTSRCQQGNKSIFLLCCLSSIFSHVPTA